MNLLTSRLRDAINAGDVPGPRIDASGPALSITGGHCDDNLLPYEWHATEVGVADGVENVQHKMREVIKYGADVIKICATGGVLSLGDNPQHRNLRRRNFAPSSPMRTASVARLPRTPMAPQGILWATEAGVDSIEHGSYIDDAGIAAMKQHGTYLVPTLYLSDWFLENAPKTTCRRRCSPRARRSCPPHARTSRMPSPAA